MQLHVLLQYEHSASVNCMATNPNMTILATGSDDNTVSARSYNVIFTKRQVRVWNMGALCQPLMALSGHSKYITCVYIHENFVLSGSADCTIKRWDLGTGELKVLTNELIMQRSAGQCTFTYKGHEGMINRIICTGDLLLSSSYDCSARAW